MEQHPTVNSTQQAGLINNFAAAAKSLSRVRLLATPWTAAYQAPPSMGFSRQEYQGEAPLPSPNYFATHGKWWLPFTRGENDVRLAYQLPGKPAAGAGGKHLVTD